MGWGWGGHTPVERSLWFCRFPDRIRIWANIGWQLGVDGLRLLPPPSNERRGTVPVVIAAVGALRCPVARSRARLPDAGCQSGLRPSDRSDSSHDWLTGRESRAKRKWGDGVKSPGNTALAIPSEMGWAQQHTQLRWGLDRRGRLLSMVFFIFFSWTGGSRIL